MQHSEFRMLSNLVAISVVQGGPGFPVFLPVIYDYIATGEYIVKDIQDPDVPDCQVQCLLAKVYVYDQC